MLTQGDVFFRRESARDDAYLPLESLYSVVPILAAISQDGGKDSSGVKGDDLDSLLLERNLDLINQVSDQSVASPPCPPSPPPHTHTRLLSLGRLRDQI